MALNPRNWQASQVCLPATAKHAVLQALQKPVQPKMGECKADPDIVADGLSATCSGVTAGCYKGKHAIDALKSQQKSYMLTLRVELPVLTQKR